jgi:hypothetical protein
MAKKDANGNWLAADGNSVPQRFVPKQDKARDAMVEKIVARARKLNQQIAAFDGWVDQEIGKFMDGAAKEAGITRNPGGNQIFTSFSGDQRVEVKVCKFIDFDEKLQFAKQKIDNCLSRWSEGAKEKEALRGVIARAFKQTRKGYLDTKMVLGLRGYQVKDQEWQEAMELISQAVTITGSKAYKMFSRRDEKGNWRGIPIDISRI